MIFRCETPEKDAQAEAPAALIIAGIAKLNDDSFNLDIITCARKSCALDFFGEDSFSTAVASCHSK
jgi:hypothetical protein